MYESVDSRAILVTFNRGDKLPLIERGMKIIYVLMTGQVKLCSTTEGGKEIILDVVGPGGAFGPLDEVVTGTPVADAAPLSALNDLASEAVAISKGNAFRFSHEYFNELVQKRPKLVVNLTKLLGTKRKQLEFRLSRLLYRSSLGKVAGLLAELGERYGAVTKNGIKLEIRLTHQEMASIIGVKRETVSEALAELEYQEIIETGRNSMVILKPGQLDSIQ
jgi:CRP/FNR family transcriptional regulator, cyclic AMP receptor protein